MELTIQSLDIDVPGRLQNAIKTKAAYFERVCQGIQSCDIILKKTNTGSDDNCNIVIKLSLPHKPIFASKKANSFEHALDVATAAIRHQLLRRKEVSGTKV